MMPMQPYLILGSRSPRRSQLLTEAGYSFTIRVNETDESFDPTMPVLEVAEMLACRKAEALRDELTSEEVLLTADSVVILDQMIYNKPRDAEDAKQMLGALSGKTHTVATGVCILSRMEWRSMTVFTQITFDLLDDSEIDHYLDVYRPYDKAGSYGVQDWIGLCKVSKIDGSYSNVMGLPMREVYHELCNFQIFPTQFRR
ncbi:MAG: Maf family protein [Saprospiraceae bacterium]|jgi:septum formation protein|nr:Maf family protein [Saprospiraceae bacterium]